MSDLLSIGASGVRAYQSALTVTGENIANTGAAGYAKRSVGLSEVVSVSGIAGKIVAGNGVVVGGVARAADGFRAAAVRSAGADLARTEAGSVWLDRVQSSLTGAGLGDRLTAFFVGAQTLAADPTSQPQRAVMLEDAKSLAAAFTTTGQALDAGMTELDATARQATATLDTLGQALAKVNDGLGRTPAGTAGAAQLADQRDQLLEQMSAIADVSVTTDTIGRATVTLGGAGGPALVDGVDAGHVIALRSGG
ncbi:FlgK family flagellar hook-associated protein, partial [Sphingomonas bacterium]|uniref:FlgK family flagellar hook-associated protein n=1 Tax=Sphingomonas bacterium TaxID=1895847 RepID=UPI003F68AD35